MPLSRIFAPGAAAALAVAAFAIPASFGLSPSAAAAQTGAETLAVGRFRWVTDEPSVRNARNARRANHVDPGPLQRSSGDQSYVIPAGALDGNHRSVVIWCRTFGVPFASAPLS